MIRINLYESKKKSDVVDLFFSFLFLRLFSAFQEFRKISTGDPRGKGVVGPAWRCVSFCCLSWRGSESHFITTARYYNTFFFLSSGEGNNITSVALRNCCCCFSFFLAAGGLSLLALTFNDCRSLICICYKPLARNNTNKKGWIGKQTKKREAKDGLIRFMRHAPSCLICFVFFSTTAKLARFAPGQKNWTRPNPHHHTQRCCPRL
jgi:hypothetical protein